MIPTTMHWIWFGQQAMPAAYQDYIARAKALHPSWTHKVWTDADVEGFETIGKIRAAKTFAGKADIARLEILWREGGVYLDCDIEVLRALDPLLALGRMVVCHEDADFAMHCTNSFIAAVPNHPAMRRGIDAILQLDPNAGPPNKVTGPFLLRRVLGDDFVLLPTAAFYPYNWNEPESVLAQRDLSYTFAIHRWAGSWLSTEQHVLKAADYAKHGYLMDACQKLDAILDEQPEHREALQCYGYAKFGVITKLADMLHRLADNNPEFLYDLGVAFRSLGSAEAVLHTIEGASRTAERTVQSAAVPPVHAAASQATTSQASAAHAAAAYEADQLKADEVAQRIARMKSQLVFRHGTDDDKFVIPELIDQDMFHFGTIAKLAPQGRAAIVDCGAHIGVFSSLCAEHMTNAVVHSFEPQPDNHALLAQNAARYGGRVVAHAEAVGLTEGTFPLYRDGCEVDGHTGRWTMTPAEGDIATIDHVDVKVRDLNRFLREIEEPLFLVKFDLEGFEAEILAGLDMDVLSRIGVLVIEEHHCAIDHARIQKAGFQLGFRPFNSPRHYVYVNPRALS